MEKVSKSLRVFLSYASEQDSIAELLYLAMQTSGHDVFFDKLSLPAGDEFDQAILDRIRTSDLMVFLVSPDSLKEGAYARTELRFARETWPDPRGHVLPVLAVPMDSSLIPAYLTTVTTYIRPEGNLTAEVSARVNHIAAGRAPGDTIAAKAELIDHVAQETQSLRRSHRLSELDRQWQREKDTNYVQTNVGRFAPSPAMAKCGKDARTLWARHLLSRQKLDSPVHAFRLPVTVKVHELENNLAN